MQFSSFENAYFLQSIGWAIINSLWQAALLWFIYYAIVSFNKRSSSVFKHDLSLLMLMSSFVWFIITIIQTYTSIKSAGADSNVYSISLSVFRIQTFNNLLPYLSFVYTGLLCLQVVRLVNGYRQIVLFKQDEVIKAPLDIRLFVRDISGHMDIKKKVQVWLSDKIDVPSVIGFVKPVILLPAAVINQLTVTQTEAILLHELAHIRRNDYFINVLQSLVETILFFNPFTHLLGNHIRKERENCCDDWVINYQYNRHDYATALLMLEEQRRQQLILAMAATNKKNILLNRVKRMFSTQPAINTSTGQRLQMIFISAILLFGIFCLFLCPSVKTVARKNITTPENTSFNIIPSPFLYRTGIKEIAAAEPINMAVKKTLPKKPVHIVKEKPEENYTLALVNEDLLNENNIDNITPVTVSSKETVDSVFYVKVTEEQSGKKQQNVYYFKMNKDNGKTSVKPLLLMQKHVHQKSTHTTTTDSTNVTKIRITS